MGDKFEQTDAFKKGLQIRKEVLGDAYVEKALEGVMLVIPINLSSPLPPSYRPELEKKPSPFHTTD